VSGQATLRPAGGSVAVIAASGTRLPAGLRARIALAVELFQRRQPSFPILIGFSIGIAGCLEGTQHAYLIDMPILLIILLLVLLFGGGGVYYGRRAGWGGPHYGGGLVGLVVVILVILWATGNLGGLR
jgi:Protein of unknown function (DUF3309)